MKQKFWVDELMQCQLGSLIELLVTVQVMIIIVD